MLEGRSRMSKSKRKGLVGPRKATTGATPGANSRDKGQSTSPGVQSSGISKALAKKKTPLSYAATAGVATAAGAADTGAPSGGAKRPSKTPASAANNARGRAVDRVTGKKKGTLFSAAPTVERAQSHDGARKRKRHSTGGKGAAIPPPQSLSGPNAAPSASAPAHDASASAHQASSKKARRKAKRVKTATGTTTDATPRPDQAVLADFKPVVAIAVPQPSAGGTSNGAAPDGNVAACPHDGKSNWERLKDVVNVKTVCEKRHGDRPYVRPRKLRAAQRAAAEAAANAVAADGIHEGQLVPRNQDTSHTDVVALDCEMVGVGVSANRSALARVCVVNEHGNVLLDLFVRPKEKVTDFRTKYSGIRPSDLKDGVTMEAAMARVHELLRDRVVVGHGLANDFKVLMLEGSVSRQSIRDTAVYPPLMAAKGGTGSKLRSRALRKLAEEELGVVIQEGEHSPVIDSRAALYLYQKHRYAWEQGLKAGTVKALSVKAAGRLAKGDFRAMALRAAATPAAPAPVNSDDEEFAQPSLEAVARMKARMQDASLDEMADT